MYTKFQGHRSIDSVEEDFYQLCGHWLQQFRKIFFFTFSHEKSEAFFLILK